MRPSQAYLHANNLYPRIRRSTGHVDPVPNCVDRAIDARMKAVFRIKRNAKISRLPGDSSCCSASMPVRGRRSPGERRQRPAAGETGVQVMPGPDIWLPELPAEKHLSPIHDTIEIAESVGTLELDTEASQFVDVAAQLAFLGVQLRLALGQFLGVEVVGGPAPFFRDHREPLLQI